MKEQLHIQISAASAARRARIAELVRRNVKQASIARVASLAQPAAGDAPSEVWIVDFETSSAAVHSLTSLADWPEGFGVVALIDDPGSQWVRDALDAGVNAIIARMPDPEELRLAIEAAEAGLVLLHPSSARELAAGSAVASQPDFEESEHLTAREREVLLLIGEGLGNKQIAARLGISEHTAKFHISSILGKLSVSSRAEAVSQGIRRGLIPI
jgi:DNA-binding NarL/FixJ family response regulator